MSQIINYTFPCRFCRKPPVAVRFVSGEWSISCCNTSRGGCAIRPCVFGRNMDEVLAAWATCNSTVDSDQAVLYRYLRARPVDAIALSKGGVFAGQVPQNIVLNGVDLDVAIRAAMQREMQTCS